MPRNYPTPLLGASQENRQATPALLQESGLYRLGILVVDLIVDS